MANTNLKLNWPALIELSNEANEQLARPIAERVASVAGEGVVVDDDSRGSKSGWARTRVLTTTVESMRRESREGTLARALGGI